MDLNAFLNNGITGVAETAARFYANSFKGKAFMLHTLSAIKKSAIKRARHEKNGLHIPPFLIAGICSACNLRCAGCYARAVGACGDGRNGEMSVGEWARIFKEAGDAGVSFIMLAGGEPLLRPDIISAAAAYKNILFPIFTNGTVLDDKYLALFDKHRNLIPVLSIEGDGAQTDLRRGKGVAAQVEAVMQKLKARNILYGNSVTVSKDNLAFAADPTSVRSLRKQGCGLLFFVEYVPAEDGTEHLALSDADSKNLQNAVTDLRKAGGFNDMMIISFPGDEEKMGGCLAAGRGFFYINPQGGAEPCPFSPYSDISLRDNSLIEVLQSEFFKKIRTLGAAESLNRQGGCTLFNVRSEVENALKK